MRLPQLVICERNSIDRPLAGLLTEAAERHNWWLREVQHPDACLRLLRDPGPSVLVLEIGHDLARQFSLLDRVAWLCPHAAAVVVGSSENPALSNLAWDLGARFVLFPPLPLELLPEVVTGLLQPKEPPRSVEVGSDV